MTPGTVFDLAAEPAEESDAQQHTPSPKRRRLAAHTGDQTFSPAQSLQNPSPAAAAVQPACTPAAQQSLTQAGLSPETQSEHSPAAHLQGHNGLRDTVPTSFQPHSKQQAPGQFLQRVCECGSVPISTPGSDCMAARELGQGCSPFTADHSHQRHGCTEVRWVAVCRMQGTATAGMLALSQGHVAGTAKKRQHQELPLNRHLLLSKVAPALTLRCRHGAEVTPAGFSQCLPWCRC